MNKKNLFLSFLLSILFVLLFYKQDIGLNNFLFNLLLLLMLYFTGRIDFKNKLWVTVASGTFFSSLMVLINNSDLAITINYLSLFLLAGITVYNHFKNLFTIGLSAFTLLFTSQINFIKELLGINTNNAGVSRLARYIKLIVIPLIIVFAFALMYKVSNPYFEEYTLSFFDSIDKLLSRFFDIVDINIFWVWVFGLLVSNFLLLGKKQDSVLFFEKNTTDELVRKKVNNSGKHVTTGLITEYKTGIILFTLLNILLLVVNLLDVVNVWFGFKWNGQYLKQFIHEGTYMLLFSIFISIVITLYYFRGNLNFYKKNRLLKRLAALWLFQNALLTVSVGIRNFWYIHYYNLAYLRIGVIFFLIFTLAGIYLVFIKIKSRKSGWYVFRKSSLAVYLILVVMTFFNWDVIIARYNFAHYKTAFIHYNFLSSLSNKALPWLDKPLDELEKITALQKKQPFKIEKWYQKPDAYYNAIEEKKKSFLASWPEKGFLSWNYADARAYRLLTTNLPSHQK